MGKIFAPGPRNFSSPFVDGKLAVDVRGAFAAGKFHHVPILIGSTDADMGGKTGFMVSGAHAISGLIAQHDPKVWAYRFSYVAQSLSQKGANHATDVPYFLNTETIRYGKATTARDKAVGRMVSAYIVNFAKQGDPNGGKLPNWPRYDSGNDTLLNMAAKDPWGGELDRITAK